MKLVGGFSAFLGFVWLAWAVAPVATAHADSAVAIVQPLALGAIIARLERDNQESARADAEANGAAADRNEATDPVESGTQSLADAGGESAAASTHDSGREAESSAQPAKPAKPADVVEAAEPADVGEVAEPADVVDDPEGSDEVDPEAQVEIEAGAETEAGRRPFELLGTSVPAGETRSLQWSGVESFVGDTASASPVLVAHGIKDGPVLCLSAAVHGDELNGIEIVRRVLHDVDAAHLSGTVIGVPIVNVWGFQRASRYLPDRRDLNRYFPGSPGGSSASRIAYAFFEGIIRHCDMLVDIHTGSFHRTNLTQLRADVSRADVRQLCSGFGDMPVLHNVGSPGTLRRAATDAGIPTVTIEAGEPMRLEAKVVTRGVLGVMDLIAYTKMGRSRRLFGSPQPVFYRSAWVRSDSGGILFAKVGLGDDVNAGEELGVVTDPMTNLQSSVRSPFKGTILGKAVNQFVMPGFAVFRVGIETSGEDLGNGGPPTTLGSEPSLDESAPSGPSLELEERPE